MWTVTPGVFADGEEINRLTFLPGSAQGQYMLCKVSEGEHTIRCEVMGTTFENADNSHGLNFTALYVNRAV